MINHSLAKQRNLSAETISAIENLHLIREKLEFVAATNEPIAKIIYPLWVENEYTLQELWGFKRDSTYHRNWHYPFCTCPKVDNDDSYPTGYYYRTMGCPIHG